MRQWSLERWPENGYVSLGKDLVHLKEEIRQHRLLVEAAEAAEVAKAAASQVQGAYEDDES